MRKIILTGGLLGLLVGGLWWWFRPTHPAPVNASIYESDMIEALVRGVLPELQPSPPPVCFLAFGDGTTAPSQAFIARFAGTRPAVRSCDNAAMPPVGRQFEISTGKPGCLIHVVQFEQITPDAFDVVVRFSHLPAGQDRFGYRVTKFAGNWTVKNRKAM